MIEETPQDGMGRTQRAIKRATDIVCSAVGLVVLSPVFLLVRKTVRCSSGR